MKNAEQFKMILTVLSTLCIRLGEKDICEIFSMTKKTFEEFLQFAKSVKGIRQGNDGKFDFFYNGNGEKNSGGISLDFYVDAVCYMVKKEKLDWTMLEIDRLRKEFENLFMAPDDVLTITNRVGMRFEEEKDFQRASEIYMTGSKYCDKNNLKKDVFVDCVLHLSKLHFMRFFSNHETVKLQEKALSLVNEGNCSRNDGLLMVYTGVNQANTYRDEDGAVMRHRGVRILESYDGFEAEDAFYITAWHYNWSGEISKIVALYENTMLSSGQTPVKKVNAFMYLPIIFAYFYWGEYSKALVISENLYKDALREKDTQAAAMMLSVIGRSHVYMNNLDKAESVLYDALDTAKQVDYVWGTYYTLIALGLLHYKRNNPKGCMEVMELSDQLSRSVNIGNVQNSPFVMDVFHMISDSGLETALPSYDEKVDSFLKSNSYLMKGVAMRHDANRRAAREEQPEVVISTYKESIDLLSRTGSMAEIGTSQAMLAKYLIKIKNMEAAKKYAQQAYENLYAKTPELLPMEIMGLINTEMYHVDMEIKVNTLALELNHIMDEARLIIRMMTSLERLLRAECGALVVYQNGIPGMRFSENLRTEEEESGYQSILGICSYTREAQKIYTKCKDSRNRFVSKEPVLLSIERTPSFLVAIPVFRGTECDAVIYVESYLRSDELTHEESQALTSFAEDIASHFYAVVDYRQGDYSTAEKGKTALEDISLGYCKSSNSIVMEAEKMIKRVAQTDVPVLVCGETGVGKEYFAKEVFANSSHQKIFIKVNCGAIPESLIESELFGYEKGSFTGATQRKIGYFEAAEGGTVFLDEIGELSMYAQTKLLRVLQEKTLMRVGGTSEINVNFRLVAATNKDLEKEVEAGTFRQDLYYRLNLIQLNIPPLRERKDDIINFAKFFVRKFEQQLGESGHYLSEDTLLWMLEYGWPGNIRELENVIHRAVLLADGKEIRIDPIKKNKGKVLGNTKVDTLEEMERKYILQVLELCDGKVSGPGGAAELLGVKRTTLTSKMEKLGIIKKS